MNNPLAKSIQRALDNVDKKASYVVFSSSQKLLPRIKSLLVALEWSGNGIIWMASSILLILWNSQQSSLSARLLIGLIIDIVYVAMFKALARRRRPTYAYQRDQMIVAGVDKHSFPSGHCSRATYVAFFVNNFASSPFLIFMVNVWAISVCVSRVLLGRHHIFDCLAGAALGWLNYFVQLHSSVNIIGMVLLRAIFGSRTFSDPNDMDGMDPSD